MPSAKWNPAESLKRYGLVLARKMGLVAAGWLAIYFLTQPFRIEASMLTLFGPVVGAVAGLVAGWYLATDAVEDSGMQGLALWVVLVVGAVLPMWLMEGLMHLVTRIFSGRAWPLNFGGFMILTAATLLAMAAAVWHASSQE